MVKAEQPVCPLSFDQVSQITRNTNEARLETRTFTSRHFYDEKDAENFAWPRALRGGALVCWGGKHRVGFGWRKFGHHNKLISLQQRWGEKPPPSKTRKRNKLGINSQAGGRRGGGKCWKLVQTSDMNNVMVSDRKGRAHGKARLRTMSSGTP